MFKSTCNNVTMSAFTSWRCLKNISIYQKARNLHVVSLRDDIFDRNSLANEVDVQHFNKAFNFAREKIAPIALNCDNESKFPR